MSRLAANQDEPQKGEGFWLTQPAPLSTFRREMAEVQQPTFNTPSRDTKGTHGRLVIRQKLKQFSNKQIKSAMRNLAHQVLQHAAAQPEGASLSAKALLRVQLARDCLRIGGVDGTDGQHESRHPATSRMDPWEATAGGPLSGPLETQKD